MVETENEVESKAPEFTTADPMTEEYKPQFAAIVETLEAIETESKDKDELATALSNWLIGTIKTQIER